MWIWRGHFSILIWQLSYTYLLLFIWNLIHKCIFWILAVFSCGQIVLDNCRTSWPLVKIVFGSVLVAFFFFGCVSLFDRAKLLLGVHTVYSRLYLLLLISLTLVVVSVHCTWLVSFRSYDLLGVLNLIFKLLYSLLGNFP